MDQMIKGLKRFTNAYSDNLVIYSSGWEEQLSHLELVFTRLKEAELTIKLKKCQFTIEKCNYLGHKIGRGATQPEERKIHIIQNYPNQL